MEKEEFDTNIRGKIEQIRVEMPRLGYRRLLPLLKKNGITLGERKLRTVLDEFNLQLKSKKNFIRTTDSKHPHPIYPNLLREFKETDINQVWVSDITYIRIQTGFVFLAIILDRYSRKIIGWNISKNIDRHLVLYALEMALKRRSPPIGTIHHSDRGVQYLCDDYINMLKINGFRISCSRKGNPYDNAFAESFMKTIKHEEVYLWEYESMLDVLDRVPHFIEEVYNKKRPHSSLGNISPEEFEKELKVE